MEKRTILAFALSLIVLIGWSALFGPKNAPLPQKDTTGNKQSVEVSKNGVENRTDNSPTSFHSSKSMPVLNHKDSSGRVQTIKEKKIIINTPLYRAVFINRGPGIISFRLKKYRETTDPLSPLIELVHLRKDKWRFMSTSFGMQPAYGKDYDSSVVYRVKGDGDINLQNSEAGFKDISFVLERLDGLVVRQTFRFYANTYTIDHTVDIINHSGQPVPGKFFTQFNVNLPDKKGYYSHNGFVLLKDNSLEEVVLEKPGEKESFIGRIDWCAYEDTYFITAVIPKNPSHRFFNAAMLAPGLLSANFFGSDVSVSPGGNISAVYKLYIGPRDLGILKAAGANLDRAVNFGWTDIIAKPLLYFLRLINQYVHNYGISIIILTILIKIIFWPLSHKSYLSMKEMQKLQPRMAKIREKYKDDREQMNKEIMALYKTYKVNPMGGCLPMIIQLPVFFALYRLLGCAIELRHAPFMLWITDLSAPDRLFNFSFHIPFMTPPYGIPVLTILMGVSMFIQQKMTPTAGDPTQAKIMLLLPIVFTVMFINFPSGLVLYWLVNNIISIVQQYFIQKRSA